jgi:hypothetical protein
MKKKQNPIQKKTFTLATVNRSLKVMALALIGLFSGVVKSEADTRAIIGKAITYHGQSLTQDQYNKIMQRRNPNPELEPALGKDWYAYYRNNEVYAYYGTPTSASIGPEKFYDVMILTSNGLFCYAGRKGVFLNRVSFIDFNELTVNRAMAAAPIGSLRVTPSNNPSEQTKVQWNVQ